MVRYRSRKVEVDGAVYQVRAQSKDGRVQVKVKVRGGGEAVGELVAPADHLAALGRAVGEVARAFGGRAWTMTDPERSTGPPTHRGPRRTKRGWPPRLPVAAPWRSWPTSLDASRARSRAAFATSSFVTDRSHRTCSYREVTNTWPTSVANTIPCRGSVPSADPVRRACP